MEILWLVVMLSAFDLFAGGLFYMFDSDVDPNYLNELRRYQAGELWWWEVRNNERELSKKLKHCRETANKIESNFYSILCEIQTIKYIVNYYAKSWLKQTLGFVQKNSELIASFIIICTFGFSLAYIIDRRIYYLGKLNRDVVEENSDAETAHINQLKEESFNNDGLGEREDANAPINTEEPSQQSARKDEESNQIKVKLMRKSTSGPRSEMYKSREGGQTRKIGNASHF